MRRFKSQHHAQKFLSCYGVVNNLFRLGSYMMRAKNYRILRDRAFIECRMGHCGRMDAQERPITYRIALGPQLARRTR